MPWNEQQEYALSQLRLHSYCTESMFCWYIAKDIIIFRQLPVLKVWHWIVPYNLEVSCETKERLKFWSSIFLPVYAIGSLKLYFLFDWSVLKSTIRSLEGIFSITPAFRSQKVFVTCISQFISDDILSFDFSQLLNFFTLINNPDEVENRWYNYILCRAICICE